MGGEWLEARSTRAGILDRISLPNENVPEKAPRYDAVFSIVETARNPHVRGLPTLYFGRSPIYGDRDAAKVGDRLAAMIDLVSAATERAIYLLHACRIDRRVGLYGRDLHNRTAFRNKLARQGMEFAPEPSTEMHEDGRFEAAGWGGFEPSFVILSGSTRDPETIVTTNGALFAYRVGRFRVGRFFDWELGVLGEFVRNKVGIAAGDPGALVAEIHANGKMTT